MKQPELKPEHRHLPNLLNLKKKIKKKTKHLINKDIIIISQQTFFTKAYNAVPKAVGDISCIRVL